MSVKRKIGWTLAGIAIFFILAIAAGYFYIRSSSFQQFAVHKIVEEADQATGGKTEIGGLDFKLSALTAHLYNITVRGTEGPGQPPLLHADKLTVTLKILSALHHKVELHELLIERPVVHVQVNREGKNNLPTAPPSQSSSHTSVFDLAVGHVQLTNGEVNYNDRKSPLQADLFDLQTDIHFASLAKRYDGNLSYDNGHLKYAQYAPLPHNLNLTFSATADRFQLSSMSMKIGSSELLLHAQVSNYSSPVADGDYRIRIHTQDFAAMSPSAAPAGDVALNGKLRYQAVENQPLLRNVSLDGQVASDLLTAAASGRRIEVRKLQGTYRLGGGNLQLTNLSLDSMGGRIVATADMKHLDATPESSVHASLGNISLKALQHALGPQANQAAALSGTLRGKADAAWKGSINNLRAHADLFLQAAASSRSNPSAKEVPVSGALHVAYDGPRQTIDLHDTAFRLPSASITAQGSISDHSTLQLQVVANDLHQLAALATSFRSAQAAPPAVSGSATLNASVQGSMKKPAVTAQLNAQNLQVEGSQWNTAKVTMHANPSGVTVDNVSLSSSQRGQVTLTGSIGLKNWSYEPANPVKAHLDARQLRLSDLQKLAKQNYPISGDLSANVNLSGSQLEPVGSGSMQIANARAYGEPIQTLTAKFQAQNGTVVSALNVAAPAGAIDANLSYTPKTKAYKVQLNAPAVVLQKLRNVQEKNLDVNGTINASVNGAGTLDDPQLLATVQLPQLQMRQNTISGFKAEIRVAEHRANLNLDTNVSQASIRARGTVALSGDYETVASIDTNTIPLAPLMATYAPSVPQGFQGQTELHATLKGPLKDKSKLEAHLSVPVLEAKYQTLELGIAQPIRLDYAQSVVTLQPVEIKGTGTSLRAEGRIPLAKGGSPTLTAQGSIDVRILQIISPDVRSGGVLALDIHSSGSAIQGQLDFKNVAVVTADSPIGVEKLNGTMILANDRLQVSKMTAQVGGGPVSLSGSIAYKPSIQFNLAVQGQSVRLRYPEGLRSVLDTNLAFTGTTQDSFLSGRVIVDSLSFTPDFDLSSFADQFSTTNTPSEPGFADTVKLAVNVQTLSSLNAVSSQVSIAGQAALQVGGTAGNPVITGRTTLTSGELFYRNLRYQLQRGVITFDDPNQTHPVLNVSATTRVEQYNLTLTLRGPLDKLTTEYVSDPPLATADVINLIARGKTTQEQAASSQSTDSMIASQVAGQLSSGVQKLAGISSLQIDPSLGGNNQNPSARIALQQRVTKNLLFSFSTDVSQPGSEIVQGEYQINKRWSVSLQRDQLGGVSVDGRYHTKF
ncbi:MAG TPA: translocation/assembly module TamB domain-containing protein [Candidatus Sulfotelmatobacter sp.]|nr:translocation/assembly module TamB domain-containing protein [Candidatus Sulfotelmatobacter sp.]